MNPENHPIIDPPSITYHHNSIQFPYHLPITDLKKALTSPAKEAKESAPRTPSAASDRLLPRHEARLVSGFQGFNQHGPYSCSWSIWVSKNCESSKQLVPILKCSNCGWFGGYPHFRKPPFTHNDSSTLIIHQPTLSWKDCVRCWYITNSIVELLLVKWRCHHHRKLNQQWE